MLLRLNWLGPCWLLTFDVDRLNWFFFLFYVVAVAAQFGFLARSSPGEFGQIEGQSIFLLLRSWSRQMNSSLLSPLFLPWRTGALLLLSFLIVLWFCPFEILLTLDTSSLWQFLTLEVQLAPFGFSRWKHFLVSERTISISSTTTFAILLDHCYFILFIVSIIISKCLRIK